MNERVCGQLAVWQIVHESVFFLMDYYLSYLSEVLWLRFINT